MPLRGSVRTVALVDGSLRDLVRGGDPLLAAQLGVDLDDLVDLAGFVGRSQVVVVDEEIVIGSVTEDAGREEPLVHDSSWEWSAPPAADVDVADGDAAAAWWSEPVDGDGAIDPGVDPAFGADGTDHHDTLGPTDDDPFHAEHDLAGPEDDDPPDPGDITAF